MTAVKAAVYLRQSLDRDGNELAVDRQREACLKLCTEKGWTPAEYVDNDTSATSGKVRKAYQRMLRDIGSGKVQAVVCWDLDRLHRLPIELEAFMKLADGKGLRLASCTGDVDLSTDNGRLFARIKGAVGMAEVERKSARQKLAADQSAKNGHPWWRLRPFGFDADLDSEGKWWTARRNPVRHNPIRLHETEAPLLIQAYADIESGDKSLSGIAADWNKANVKTATGKRWHASSVRALLLAGRNAGLREHHGTIVGTGTWPAIVEEETWRAVKAKLNDPKRIGRPVGGRTRLLTGIAVCGVCKHPLASSITHGSGRLTYVCKHNVSKDDRCMKVSRAADGVDEMVITAVVLRLSREDAIELTRRDAIDTDELRTRRENLRAQQREAAAEFAEGRLSFEFAATADKQLAAQIAELDDQLTDHSQAPVFEGLIGVEDVRTAFEELTLERKRAVIAALVTVTVMPAGRGARKVSPEDVRIKFIKGR